MKIRMPPLRLEKTTWMFSHDGRMKYAFPVRCARRWGWPFEVKDVSSSTNS